MTATGPRAARPLALAPVHALAASLVLAALAPVAHAQQPEGPESAAVEGEPEARGFAIPETRAVRALFERAKGHADARRWSAAISDLETILQDHRGDVLGPERLRYRDRLSDEPTHAGAARRARAMLFGLPREGRDLYRERFEGDATAAFERARGRGDRRALAEIARRWPLCDAAERAWWSLGDLELEHGEAADAVSAWRRALATRLGRPDLDSDRPEAFRAAEKELERRGEPLPAGLARRVALAVATLEGGGGRVAGSVDSLHVGPPSPAGGPPPGRSFDAWHQPFRLPEHPFQRQNLFPARSGDVLLVSTSLRLLALQAYSGELLWDSLEPPGWTELGEANRKDYFKGVDHEQALIAPAASAHVAIAALQVPFAFVENDTFQTIPITTILPERRLFAYDLATGRRLWDHAPPPGWDGESGGFTQRMTVAGPPTVVGRRALVPFCRMRGRINFHVGCIDVDTGELLWATDLISGQRELNMFGRAEHEFCAPPLVVSGDQVVALSQLGTIACLDLFTGEIVWQSLYPQIPLPKNRHYRAENRERTWRNAPPAIVGGVVLATPFDSSNLVAVDLATGAQIWTLENRTIRRQAGPKERIDLLLGATESTVYLAGDKLLALDSPLGLAAAAPSVPKWPQPFEHEDLRGQLAGLPRPVLGKDRIVVPTQAQRVEVELEQGRKLEAIEWSGGGGNLLLGPGELFTLSRGQANGYFEWDALVARARRDVEASPGDARRALALGQLLSSRALNEWQRGASEAARAHFTEARAVLERALGERPAAERDPAISAELHLVLRGEARVRTSLADGANALRALREARALAPDRAALRDTLLEELALLRAGDAGGARGGGRSEVLDELERSCSDLDLLCELASESPATGLPRLRPVTGSSSQSDAVPVEVPVGLWVLLERAAGHAGSDPGAAFAELHAILARHPEVDLPGGRAGELAAEEIGALLRAGHRAAHAPFEAQARSALEAALARRDRAEIGRIARLYPFSEAARGANDALLAWALEAGDVAEVSRIVAGELPGTWRVADATARELGLALHLAAALGRAGNREAHDELVRTLAAAHPGHASDLSEHGGRTLAELARGIERWRRPVEPLAAGTFAVPSRTERLEGRVDVLGFLAPEAGAPRDLLLAYPHASRRSFVLFSISPDRPQERLAETQVPAPHNASQDPAWWSTRAAFAAGRAIVATAESVVGLDAATLERAWEWRIPGGYPDAVSIACSAGVVVALVQQGGTRTWLQALDARTGAELWRETQSDAGLRPMPMLSSNRLTFLPVSFARNRYLVRDLFTGVRTQSFELDTPIPGAADQEAWIEEDRLIVPWFSRARNADQHQMIAVDLETGRPLWRIGFGELGSEPLVLEHVLQHGDRTWLVAAPWPSDKAGQSQSLFELSSGVGAVAPLAHIRIGRDDQILGASRTRRRLTLPTPHVFLLSKSARSDEARLRAIDLESGELWAQGLQIRIGEIAGYALPQPALSATHVAIAYTLSRSEQRSTVTSLAFFDRSTGLRAESRDLHDRLGKAEGLRLLPFGDGLLLRGEHRLEILR